MMVLKWNSIITHLEEINNIILVNGVVCRVKKDILFRLVVKYRKEKNMVRQFRPILIGIEFDNLPVWKKINWKWVLQRAPLLLFALVSSYGVGHLLYLAGIPFPFDYIGAVSFDIGFLGVIALADMQLNKNIWSHILFFLLNVTMAGLAALFNVLGHAGGKYANITAEDYTIGIPFALVGLCFAMYFHSIMSQYINKEIEEQEKADELAALEKEHCMYCGKGAPSKPAIYGHYKSCAMKRMHEDKTRVMPCQCISCRQAT
jgi:hypothetical protein